MKKKIINKIKENIIDIVFSIAFWSIMLLSYGIAYENMSIIMIIIAVAIIALSIICLVDTIYVASTKIVDWTTLNRH